MTRIGAGALALGWVLAALAQPVAAYAKDSYYITPAEVDLDNLLAPPAALGSAQETADLAAVQKAEMERSAQDSIDAEEDHNRSVFRFADVMGPGFTPQKLPMTTAFFARLLTDEKQIVAAAKTHFARPRPFVVDSNLSPLVFPKKTPSYPSGHTAFAYVTAIILAAMVPEKASAIFDRAATYGYNRVVAGAHFPTDIEAGRIAGTVIASVFFHDPRFLSDFDRSRQEVRTALGLPPLPDRKH
ncbi:MAG TPA: phosphatase PAP2 family protein [Acidisoma sp.]|uniref:acid phosphatase n=1 Tax=Acidisoma sp. TaxID=1872115 RepID=UPI002BEF68F2|nr:phosphatase PAP2 family protein [Acidisoma sp.]HTI03313.1 phosphatase PAP2 family protein [Acidisoma sp.]